VGTRNAFEYNQKGITATGIFPDNQQRAEAALQFTYVQLPQTNQLLIFES
jgi:hypothetical protein